MVLCDYVSRYNLFLGIDLDPPVPYYLYSCTQIAAHQIADERATTFSDGTLLHSTQHVQLYRGFRANYTMMLSPQWESRSEFYMY